VCVHACAMVIVGDVHWGLLCRLMGPINVTNRIITT
jgi:hypothetical protein